MSPDSNTEHSSTTDVNMNDVTVRSSDDEMEGQPEDSDASRQTTEESFLKELGTLRAHIVRSNTIYNQAKERVASLESEVNQLTMKVKTAVETKPDNISSETAKDHASLQSMRARLKGATDRMNSRKRIAEAAVAEEAAVRSAYENWSKAASESK